MTDPVRSEAHHFPEGDFFTHDASPECPCGPMYATVSVSGQGYTMRWHHNYVMWEPIPDCIPEDA